MSSGISLWGAVMFIGSCVMSSTTCRGNMRRFCPRCKANTIHVVSDEEKILCSICCSEWMKNPSEEAVF